MVDHACMLSGGWWPSYVSASWCPLPRFSTDNTPSRSLFDVSFYTLQGNNETILDGFHKGFLSILRREPLNGFSANQAPIIRFTRKPSAKGFLSRDLWRFCVICKNLVWPTGGWYVCILHGRSSSLLLWYMHCGIYIYIYLLPHDQCHIWFSFNEIVG